MVVKAELEADYRKLLQILRGNEKLERQLLSRNRGLDMASVLLMRLDMFIQFTMGDPTEYPDRLAFETQWGEQMRNILTKAVLKT